MNIEDLTPGDVIRKRYSDGKTFYAIVGRKENENCLIFINANLDNTNTTAIFKVYDTNETLRTLTNSAFADITKITHLDVDTFIKELEKIDY